MRSALAHYPHQVPVDTYGNGGFRFAGMSHRGSILCLPSGIHAMGAAAVEDLTPDALAPVLAAGMKGYLLLLGTGRTLRFPSSAVHAAILSAGVSLEVMDTGAAARTYNILFAERRLVAAALMAVE